ncbi:MAG: prepilin-type N-terminal cleavage/methylation domain-containing protein [Pirellulaceae bacterium]|nr:prepilin-type N-terminal cleavage/methylation domain-containing protein [Pirellulaceae bacterium]
MQTSRRRRKWHRPYSRDVREVLPSRQPCAGFTLVELLVTMAVTVILILALAQAFAVVGEVVAEGRATIEMAGSLRSVANRLQEDLSGLTVPARPWADEASGGGYLEILDGPSGDSDWNDDGVTDTNPAVSNTVYGDVDDVLAFTARSQGSPFVGERAYFDAGGNLITLPMQSHLAEIVWWIQFEDLPNNATGDGIHDPNEESFTIYRRAMLIRPDLGQLWNKTYAIASELGDLRNDLIWFFNHNDISVRINCSVGGGNVTVVMTANSLGDLTRRENRFAHLRVMSDRANTGPILSLAPVAADAPWWALPGRVFPFPMDLNRRSVTSLYRAPKTGSNAGEDVMLKNALAFDVQVFDPGAALRNSSNTAEALAPGDPAYFSGITTPIATWPPVDAIGRGAFVDLGYGHGDTTSTARLRFNASAVANYSDFAGAPHSRAGMTAGVNWRTPTYCYDTWSLHYERDGIDQDGNGVIDQGMDGFDNDGVNGVDDMGERETSPPYPVPLRGIRVTIRAIEPDTRQIRQASVISDFLPE